MFKNRIEVLVKAKNYELQQQRVLAMEAAKLIMIDKQHLIQTYFNQEAHVLVSEFRKMLDLIDFYERIVKE